MAHYARCGWTLYELASHYGLSERSVQRILRRMLDERGMEHYDGTESTLWGYEDYNEFTGIYRFSADETSDGYMQVRLWRVTPEQAIAATLGREPDDDAMVKLHDHMNAALLEYERALGSEEAEGAITVPFVAEMHRLLEEAATLGSGTCQNVAVPDEYSDRPFTCSECGARGPMGNGTYHLASSWAMEDGTLAFGDSWPVWKYCPNCGRKVVDE